MSPSLQCWTCAIAASAAFGCGSSDSLHFTPESMGDWAQGEAYDFAPGQLAAHLEAFHQAIGDNPLEAVPESLRFSFDPVGFQTNEGDTSTLACEADETTPEQCGSAVDEDCDGTVDESPLLGEPCLCDGVPGRAACDLGTSQVVCLGRDKATCPLACGNGQLDDGERCDPAAVGEALGQSCEADCTRRCGNGVLEEGEACDPEAPSAEGPCTVDCRTPLFWQCVALFAEGPAYYECPMPRTRCDRWVGACMPWLDPIEGFVRCPLIAVESPVPTDEVYPMVEQVDEEGRPIQCWVTCSADRECPSSLPRCYQGYCVVELEEPQ
jgi:hypothetical protein